MGKRSADNDIQSESPHKRFKNESAQLAGSVHDFVLTKDIVDGAVLTDLCHKDWKVGKPIGKGSFGEIFLASDDTTRTVTNDNAKFVVKIEPHSNGPLFVEIHCLINIGKSTNDESLPPGMPEYIASGSHYFNNAKYRFLILPRFKCDLHSIIKNKRIDQKNLLAIGCQVLDVLEHIHDKGYAHSDIKAENMMIGSCLYMKVVPNNQTTIVICDDSSDSDEDNCSKSPFRTPQLSKIRTKRALVEFSGSNPVRSCRMSRKTSTYQDMISSHYLRPTKKVNYCISDDEMDDDDGYNKTPPSTIKRNKREQICEAVKIIEDRIFLIDFGLASKFIDSSGNHRPFFMDQRRAHDGTLEFTSRDAHMGAHSRRSDLECLGYNLMFWYQGSLPWKDEKLMTQPEQVHRMKEYFMTDVKKVFKDVYGQCAPKFLADFLEYVGGLAYHDRPDYNYCRSIFMDELKAMGCNLSQPSIDLNELKKQPIKTSKKTENNNIRLKDVQEMMKLGILDSCNKNGSTRISPKNLRSKSVKIPKRQRKKFSWTDILSTDPDQIARQRAEKEFARDPTDTPILSRYKGKPTYAILEVENRIKFKDKLESKEESDKSDEDNIKGYTKPMMDVLRKKQLVIFTEFEKKKRPTDVYSTTNLIVKKEKLQRRKSGLRNYVKPTEKNILYRQTIIKKRRNGNSEFTPTDESSCGSATTEDSAKSKSSRRYNSSYGSSSPLISSSSDEDSRDTTDDYSVKYRYGKKLILTRKTKELTKRNSNGRVSKRTLKDDSLKQLRAFTRG